MEGAADSLKLHGEPIPEDIYALPLDNLVSTLKTNIDHGLQTPEVLSRQKTFGKNEISSIKNKSILLVFLLQFRNPVAYLLLGAVGISLSFNSYTEAFSILIVLLINALIGLWMEVQARNTMNALKTLDVATARLMRDGKVIEKNSIDLVPGDILLLEAGDIVPADTRLIHVSDLEANESTLTGEAFPVVKKSIQLPLGTILSDRVNMVYKGTSITRGKGKGVVIGTGKRTEIGKITTLIQTATEEEAPINIKLTLFSKKLMVLVLIILIPLIFYGWMQEKDAYTMIEAAIALAVAAIPEGLPIVATIALARGMLKLAKQQVIVKKLSAVETLGATSIIMTDKTGTITKNKLEVQRLCFPGEPNPREIILKNQLVSYPPGKSFDTLIQLCILCNNAEISNPLVPVGDPLEIALLEMALSLKFNIEQIKANHRRIHEHPFNAESRTMATLHEKEGGKLLTVKGATEEIIKLSSFIIEENGVRCFTEEEKNIWLRLAENMGNSGLRVIAFAYKEGNEIPLPFHDLVFCGLSGLNDPPREDVYQAIKACESAGIKVVMVTGDQPETARSIALKVGLAQHEDIRVVHGKSLRPYHEMSETEKGLLADTVIFSRVTPVQKLELVKYYQDQKFIVAMTGDGVNDAPALKQANIGIAMGIRGTQVARDTADMVLKDDSFSAIVKAVRYGRVIYDNIQVFIIYLLSCNLSEILIITLGSIFAQAIILMPIQILFLNVVTDVFPALALGMGEGNDKIMKRKPKIIGDKLISRNNWISIITYSLGLTTGILFIFLYSQYMGLSREESNTVAFYSLALAQLFHPINLSSVKSPFFNNEITKNPFLWSAVLICMVIMALTYFIPSVKLALNIAELSLMGWVYIFVGALLPIPLIQVAKKLKWIK